MSEEQVERRGADDGLDHDLAGAEPVEFFAAVQHHLPGSDRQAQRSEAEPIQLAHRVARRVGKKGRDAEEGEDADRQVDVEDKAPAIGGGQPTPEHRTQNRTGHHRNAPQGDCRSLPLLRIDVHQHRLRERDQRGAKHALQDPKQHDLNDGLRHAAQHRSDREAGDGDEENTLDPEPPGQVAGGGSHDRGGDDIGGQHPGYLVLAG